MVDTDESSVRFYRGMDRSQEIDGLRGLLAATVLAYHVAVSGLPIMSTNIALSNAAAIIALLCIVGFFVISGYVLAPMTATLPSFVLRRGRRLIPMHVACMAIGALLVGATSAEFLRGELWIYPDRSPLDGPDWSLRVEMAATILWPFIVFSSRKAIIALVSVPVFFWLSRAVWYDFIWIPFFIVGARMSFAEIRVPRISFLRSAPLQFLGRISFSLYMTHWVVIKIMGPVAGLVLAVPIAMLAYVLVEKPSLQWSRGQLAARGLRASL